jgi:hypothetical protein
MSPLMLSFLVACGKDEVVDTAPPPLVAPPSPAAALWWVTTEGEVYTFDPGDEAPVLAHSQGDLHAARPGDGESVVLLSKNRREVTLVGREDLSHTTVDLPREALEATWCGGKAWVVLTNYGLAVVNPAGDEEAEWPPPTSATWGEGEYLYLGASGRKLYASWNAGDREHSAYVDVLTCDADSVPTTLAETNDVGPLRFVNERIVLAWSFWDNGAVGGVKELDPTSGTVSEAYKNEDWGVGAWSGTIGGDQVLRLWDEVSLAQELRRVDPLAGVDEALTLTVTPAQERYGHAFKTGEDGGDAELWVAVEGGGVAGVRLRDGERSEPTVITGDPVLYIAYR